MTWTDKRMEFSESKNVTHFNLRAESIKKIWIPDFFFSNAKHGRFHDVTVPNTILWAYPNGTLMYSIR